MLLLPYQGFIFSFLLIHHGAILLICDKMSWSKYLLNLYMNRIIQEAFKWNTNTENSTSLRELEQTRFWNSPSPISACKFRNNWRIRLVSFYFYFLKKGKRIIYNFEYRTGLELQQLISIQILWSIHFCIENTDIHVYKMSLGIGIIFLLVTLAYHTEMHCITEDKACK